MICKTKIDSEVNISKADFEEYEEVRSSGETNMFDVRYVCELSGLEREQVIAIMDNYDALNNEFPDVRNNNEFLDDEEDDEEDD